MGVGKLEGQTLVANLITGQQGAEKVRTLSGGGEEARAGVDGKPLTGGTPDLGKTTKTTKKNTPPDGGSGQSNAQRGWK